MSQNLLRQLERNTTMNQFRGFQRGINLGGWFSQCDNSVETYDNFVRKEDFRTISEWGLDHVRIPVDYNLIEDDEGNYKESGFAYLDRAFNWAFENGLNVVLDLHKTYGYSFDAGENEEGFFDREDFQERFYRLWQRFAARFGKYRDRLAFELLNEVTDEAYCETWNRVANECIERIRRICPDIWILVGGYHNNSVEALKDLWMPHDEWIVYNFHCYEPLIFTHQGAYWIPTMDTGFRISIDEPYKTLRRESDRLLGQGFDSFGDFADEDKLSSAYFDRLFGEAYRISLERDVPLYCGEYGVINLADAADTVKWYEMIHETFEKYGIGRAAWSFRKMDFGFVDEHMKDVLEDIKKLM